jgi:hypothetical protein
VDQQVRNAACDPSDPDAALGYLVPMLAQMFRGEPIPQSVAPSGGTYAIHQTNR